MFDYQSWIRRAENYVRTLPNLPGYLKVTGAIRGPIDAAKINELSAACRLPIPNSLKQFWLEASAGSELRYHWSNIPESLHRQVDMASGDRFHNYLWGGPEILTAEEIVEASHHFPSWAEFMRPEFPRDARIWDHSLPVFPVGNGDYVGLYVADDQHDPPVVYASHDGDGGSSIIAENLAEFLVAWEELRYIGIDFLMNYLNPDSGRLAPGELPAQVEALRSLLEGKVRDDLSLPPLILSESDWLSARNPNRMLNWLENEQPPTDRKKRLFNCACCLRVQDRMGAAGRRALETSLRYCDGEATAEELSAVRSEQRLFNRNDLSGPQPDIMQNLGYAVIISPWFLCDEITSHLDEPLATIEQAHHADLVRHIFGNPFRAAERPIAIHATVTELAERLHRGENVAAELGDALRASNNIELADHFREPDHPRGCWALDLLLGH